MSFSPRCFIAKDPNAVCLVAREADFIIVARVLLFLSAGVISEIDSSAPPISNWPLLNRVAVPIFVAGLSDLPSYRRPIPPVFGLFAGSLLTNVRSASDN